MKIHYLSCHTILEWDEVSLLTELGHDVFSNGAYLDPAGHFTLPRPGIKGAKYHADWADIMRKSSRTCLPNEVIDPFDIFIIMHLPELLFPNWERIKHKRVIWRSIGQSTPEIERRLKPLVDEGLEIIRYSPNERNINDYVGENTLIRFYKDSEEFNGWTGKNEQVVNISQSLLGRRYFCHYDEIMQITEGFPRKVFGMDNDNLGELNGGELDYESMKQILRDNRVYVYGGTWPASYTLAFIEAMMTGIPVVAIGKKLAQESEHYAKMDFYEIPDIIENEVNGFYSDDINQLRGYVDKLLKNYNYAKEIGEKGRQKAIELFGKQRIKEQWNDYLR